jgi:hypothetical protein
MFVFMGNVTGLILLPIFGSAVIMRSVNSRDSTVRVREPCEDLRKQEGHMMAYRDDCR